MRTPTTKGEVRLLTGSAIGLALIAMAGVPAMAQEVVKTPARQQQPATTADRAPASTASENPQEIEEIVVIGTSIRGIAAVGASTVTVSREDLAATGRNSPVDVVRELPQLQGLGFDDAPRVGQNAGGNIQRGRSVNIRGLGSNATLLLIDGNRVAPSGNVFSFTEADQLPVAAIERIDVMTDGASAIYGSDAVAGVINYVTRKNFKGVEVTGRHSFTDGYEQSGGSIIGGHAWDSGNIVVAFDHDVRGMMMQGESPYLRQDLRPLGGPDTRIRTNNATAGTPGNIVVPRSTNNPTLPTAGRFDYYGIPVGSSGTGITAGQLLLNQPNLADQADYTSYLPKTVKNQVSMTARQEITPWLTANVLAFYNKRDSTLYSYPQSGVRTLPATSPYYVQGVPGVAPGARQTVVFSLYKDIGVGETSITDEQTQFSGNLRADLTNDWAAQFIANYSRNKNCANCIDELNNNVSVTALQRALDNGTYNPFSSAPASQDVLRTILPSAFDRNKSTLQEYTLRLDGPLFELPAGTVKAAVGASYLELTQWRSAIGVQASSDVPLADADRNIRAAYAEIYLPLVGEQAGVPLMQSLDFNVAVRTERYSDVGTTTNPKFGVNWGVADGVKLRGVWGRSFRAPNLIESNPEVFSRVRLETIANAARDSALPPGNTAAGTSNVVNVTGSNNNLTPEKATSYSVGFDYEPEWLRGLRASATYYNVKYSNQIIGLQGFGATFLASPTNRALFAPYITVAPQPSTCVNGNPATYNAAYLVALSRPSVAAIDQSNFCSAQAITDTRNANAAAVKQDGIDITLNYRFETGESNWMLSLSGTKILNNNLQLTSTGSYTNALDIMNQPISERGRAGITWNMGPYTVAPALNYVGSYTNNIPITVNGVTLPVEKVPAWVTFDLMMGYEFSELGSWGDGLRASFNVRNLMDRNPPIVLSANGNAFDPQGANVFGRIVSFQLSKSF